MKLIVRAVVCVFVFALCAAQAQTIEVTIKGPKNTITSSVIVNPQPVITNINCTPGTVNEGDMVSCAVIIDRNAPAGGYKFAVLNVPGVTSLVITGGTNGAAFSFFATLPPPIAANGRPLLMPFRGGANVGLSADRFLTMLWYEVL